MDLIVRLTRKSSLPSVTGSSISAGQVRSSDEYFVACAGSENEMSGLSPIAGTPVMLPRWSSTQPVAGQTPDLIWDLVPPEAQQRVQNATEAVQLMVESGNLAVDLLPWESLSRLNLNSKGLSVARLVPSALKPPPMTVVPPLRILLVTSNATDDLAFSERDRSILRDSAEPQFYNVRETQEATETSVMVAIHEFDPHIIHFLGHGGLVGGEGAVLLRDEKTGAANWVRASQVSRMLPVSTRLMCISTGFSQRNYDINGLIYFALAPKTVRLPTSILNRSEIDEAAVRIFWGQFYSNLVGESGNVLKAYNSAIAYLGAAAGTSTPPESFSLVLREGGYRPMRVGKTVDMRQYAAEVQAQLAARLAGDLKEKSETFEGTETGRALQESYSEERSRFSTFSSTAASFESE